MRRRFVWCGFVMGALVGCTAVLAESEGQWLPTIDDPLLEADLVARVRIESRKELTFEYEGQTLSCGLAYRAEILESIRGQPSGSVTFSFDEAVPAGGTREFLLVAHRWGAGARTGDAEQLPGMSDRLRAESKCAAQETEYKLAPWPRCLIPFGTKGTPDTSTKWLDWGSNDCCVERMSAVNAQQRTGVDVDRWWIPWEDMKREMRKQIEQAR